MPWAPRRAKPPHEPEYPNRQSAPPPSCTAADLYRQNLPLAPDGMHDRVGQLRLTRKSSAHRQKRYYREKSGLAASLESLRCGPPEVSTQEHFEQLLRERVALSAGSDREWIRVIGYHESVAGDIDRRWLDRVAPETPVRVQHRSGRLWIINSCGLERLAKDADRSDMTPLQDPAVLATGRLYDADQWLRQRLGGQPPALHRVSALLASFGLTGVTDASARNSQGEYRHFVDCAARGELLQRLIVMGDAGLDEVADVGAVRRGPTKIYLRESALPAVEDLCASIAPADVLSLLAEHSLTVVTQPNFVRERGDAYLADVPARDQPWLYRGRGFLAAGVALAAGADAPLGDPNPWLAMQAAVDRRTMSGRTLGEAEALSPEEALALFGGDPLAPGGAPMRIAPGSPADLCLLDRPWSAAR